MDTAQHARQRGLVRSWDGSRHHQAHPNLTGVWGGGEGTSCPCRGHPGSLQEAGPAWGSCTLWSGGSRCGGLRVGPGSAQDLLEVRATRVWGELGARAPSRKGCPESCFLTLEAGPTSGPAGLGARPGLEPAGPGRGLPGFGACPGIGACRLWGLPRGSGPAQGLGPTGAWGQAAARGLPARTCGWGRGERPAPGGPGPARGQGGPLRPAGPAPPRAPGGPCTSRERPGAAGGGGAGRPGRAGAAPRPGRSGARAERGGGQAGGAGRRKMANVGLQFQASAGDADPQSRPLLLLGQLHHLHRVPWSHVRGKLQPRVTEEVSGPRGRPEAPPGARRGARPAREARGGSFPPRNRLQALPSRGPAALPGEPAARSRKPSRWHLAGAHPGAVRGRGV